jgi:hypothetical protein
MGLESSDFEHSGPTEPADVGPVIATAPSVVAGCSNVAASSQIPRCKLVTRLVQDPTTDLTQIVDAAGPNDSGAVGGPGDIACGKAYEMLIKYATSEDKIDQIAHALENGCTMKGDGSCAIKSMVFLEALDRVSS